jgi:RNA polymerase sigma factor (sigma-70 family)
MADDRTTSLYRSYGAVIYARCRAILADEAAAEDATQETFVRVYRHLARAPDDQTALYWIYRIATNLCLNELRRRRRGQAKDDGAMGGLCGELDPERRIADRDLVRRLVDALPPRAGSAAWLYHVDGFEQEEIGRILGVSRRTISSWLAQAAAGARSFLRRSEV